MYKLGWDPTVSTCKLVLDPWLWLGEVLILVWPLVPLENKTQAFLWPWSISLSEQDSTPFLQVLVLGHKTPWLFPLTVLVKAKRSLICSYWILKDIPSHLFFCFCGWVLEILYFIFNEMVTSVSNWMKCFQNWFK